MLDALGYAQFRVTYKEDMSHLPNDDYNVVLERAGTGKQRHQHPEGMNLTLASMCCM